MTDEFDEEARRLYPTHANQRYSEKMMSKKQQRAYLRGRTHGNMVSRASIKRMVSTLHLGWSVSGAEEFEDALIDALEREGLFVQPESRED